MLADEVRKARGNRKEIVGQITESIMHRMEQEGLTADIEGREKNLYSLYNKMVSKKLSFSEVLDVYAFRIVADDVDACDAGDVAATSDYAAAVGAAVTDDKR